VKNVTGNRTAITLLLYLDFSLGYESSSSEVEQQRQHVMAALLTMSKPTLLHLQYCNSIVQYQMGVHKPTMCCDVLGIARCSPKFGVIECSNCVHVHIGVLTPNQRPTNHYTQ